MDRKCKNWPTIEELQLTKLYENNARILFYVEMVWQL